MRVHNHTSATTPLIYIIQLSRKKKKRERENRADALIKVTAEGMRVEPTLSPEPPQKINRERQTGRQTVSHSGEGLGGVLRGHLASGKITVSQSMAYDCCFPCSLQSCHRTNAHEWKM